MKIKLLFTAITLFICLQNSAAQDYEEHDVDEFYKKIELDNGTLDEDGNDIDFIFVKTDLKAGRYAVEITDAPGDLYEVKGNNIYIKFRGYYGYAGYAEEGIIEVGSSAYTSTFYKKE